MGELRERKMFVFSLGESLAMAVTLLFSVAVDDSPGLLFWDSGSGTGVLVVEGMRWTRSRASRSCWSENSSKGSRLERMVPEKRTGSWGMMERRVRRSCNLMVEMSMPSMIILPARASRKRKRARERVDLPVIISEAS
jgi:hypothetical protein